MDDLLFNLLQLVGDDTGVLAAAKTTLLMVLATATALQLWVLRRRRAQLDELTHRRREDSHALAQLRLVQEVERQQHKAALQRLEMVLGVYERRMHALEDEVAQLNTKITALLAENRELRQEIDALRRENRELYVRIDARLSKEATA